MQVSHCNICGAVLVVDEKSPGVGDTMVRRHREWHEATFAAVDRALAIALQVRVAPDVVRSELACAAREKDGSLEDGAKGS